MSVRACEQTVLYFMHAVGAFCAHSPSTCRYCVPAIRNPTILHALIEFFQKKKLIHCSSSDFEECHHQEFQFCHEDCAMMRRRRRSMRQVSLLLIIPLPSCLPINNIVIFFTSDFDVFCHLGGWVYRAASFLPCAGLAVADILVRHNNLLFVIVLFPMSVLHKMF